MKLKYIKSILLTLLILIFFKATSQENLYKSPKKAAIYSSIVPGAGQIYTKKYWKVPIIYGGLISSVYYIIESNQKFQSYKDGYIKRLGGDNDIYNDFSDAQLVTLTNFHKRNREISTLCFLGVYLLNIIDASVNAHLFSYEIDEDLSLILQPAYLYQSNTGGILLSFNL